MPRGGQSIMVSGWNDVDFDCTLGGSNSDNFYYFPFRLFVVVVVVILWNVRRSHGDGGLSPQSNDRPRRRAAKGACGQMGAER